MRVSFDGFLKIIDENKNYKHMLEFSRGIFEKESKEFHCEADNFKDLPKRVHMCCFTS